MDQLCRTAGNGRMASVRLALQPYGLRCHLHLKSSPGRTRTTSIACGIRNPWMMAWGGPKRISIHSGSWAEEVHLQNKSTDDGSCDELKLQGEKLEARREKAPGKLQAYVIPGSPFRPGGTGNGICGVLRVSHSIYIVLYAIV